MAKNKSNNNVPAETVIDKAVAVEENAPIVSEPVAKSAIAVAPVAAAKSTGKRLHISQKTAIRNKPTISGSTIIGYAAAGSEYPIFKKISTFCGICYQVSSRQYIFSGSGVREV